MPLTAKEQQELDELELKELEAKAAASASPRKPAVNSATGLPITPGREQEAAAFWSATPAQRAMMLVKGTASSRMVDPLIEGGGAAAGARIGGQMAGPLGAGIGGGVGALGGYIANRFRHGDPVRPGAAAGAAAMGAIPGAPMARAGLGGVMREGMRQGGGNLAAKALETGIDEGRLPTPGEALMAGGSGVAGATAAKFLDKGAQAMAVDAKVLQNAVRDRTLAEAAAAGYVIPPSRVNPNPVNKLLESLAGKAATAQEAVVRNQEVTNALARKAIGAPANAPLTEGLLKKIREDAAAPYEEIRTLAKQAEADLEALKKSRLTASNAHELAVQASEPSTVREMASLAKKAGADVDALKAAKFDANAYFTAWKRSGDPEAFKKATAAKALADGLEDKIVAAAEEIGKPELAAALKEARVRIAKVHQVEKALNLADGNVSAPILGRSLDAGKPLTNELKTIAKTQQAFPQQMREAAATPTAGVNQLLPIGAGLAAAQGNPQGMMAAMMFGATGPVRSGILSRPYQGLMANPSYPVRQSDLLANTARLSAQAAGRDATREPNPFLDFLRTEFPVLNPQNNQFLQRR